MNNDGNGNATVTFNQGGSELADVDHDRRVMIWSVPSGTSVATLPALWNASIATLAVMTPDLGSLIASHDKTLLGEALAPPERRFATADHAPNTKAPMSERLTRGVTNWRAAPRGTVWVWEIRSRVHQHARLTTSDPNAIDSLAFSQDERS